MTDAEVARIRSRISASTFCSHDEMTLMGEVERLAEQLRIAHEALESLAWGAQTGHTARHLSTMAEDALIQMSVVE